MPFNDQIDRAGAQALMPEDVSREIIQGVAEGSAALRMLRRLPNMTRAQQRMPVLSALATAYFVNGDTGLKQTTKLDWSNKYIDAEEIAAIVPIPDAVVDDAGYPIWDEVKPRVIEAIDALIDGAILFGDSAPASWPDDIVTGATAASQAVTLNSIGVDLYDDLFAEGGVYALLEADGFNVTGNVAHTVMKAKLRQLRDANGQPIFADGRGTTPADLAGAPVFYPLNGAFDSAQALLIAGDWNQAVYSIRQDITFKMLTEAVIQDNAGNIIYNLAQQDMQALRVVLRMGWQIPNPIKRLNTNETTRYQFAILKS